MKNQLLITGYFEDDKDLLKAVKALREKNIAILDVQTPFPVHGLDIALGYERSRLPKAAFVLGVLGAITAFGFQSWVFTSAWPLNFGGKPFWSIPSFIPVTFELTVLFAAFALVFGFLIRSKLGPGAPNIVLDPDVTNDHFLVVLDASKEIKVDVLSKNLEDVGAIGIKEVSI